MISEEAPGEVSECSVDLPENSNFEQRGPLAGAPRIGLGSRSDPST